MLGSSKRQCMMVDALLLIHIYDQGTPHIHPCIQGEKHGIRFVFLSDSATLIRPKSKANKTGCSSTVVRASQTLSAGISCHVSVTLDIDKHVTTPITPPT